MLKTIYAMLFILVFVILFEPSCGLYDGASPPKTYRVTDVPRLVGDLNNNNNNNNNNNSNRYWQSISYGSLLKHNLEEGEARQDISGIIASDSMLMLVDDGGKKFKENTKVRFLPLDQMELTILDINATEHAFPGVEPKDLEGATWENGFFYTTSSFNKKNKPDYQLFSRFQFDNSSSAIAETTMVNLYDHFVNALRQSFGAKWYQETIEETTGDGLNIEGLSHHHNKTGTFMFGLRSPLDKGNAIVAEVTNAFGDPEVRIFSIDLEGHGIRSIEWVEEMNGYVIVSGSSDKQSERFHLWNWNPDHNNVKTIELEGFNSLCRPEALAPIRKDSETFLLVASEESGDGCNKSKFSYILAKLNVLDR